VPPDDYPFARGNLAAEANAGRFGSNGGVGVVLRFGLFYGPGAHHSEQFLAMARGRIVPVLGAPDSYLSSIHVADAAAAVETALHLHPGTYNVVDDEPLTKRDYAEALARAAGRRPWLRGPGRIARVMGSRLTSLTRSLRVSNSKLKSASTWSPRYPDARSGWLATAKAANDRSP
jgi:nucleoside-diphosphate-sugar epimerase